MATSAAHDMTIFDYDFLEEQSLFYDRGSIVKEQQRYTPSTTDVFRGIDGGEYWYRDGDRWVAVEDETGRVLMPPRADTWDAIVETAGPMVYMSTVAELNEREWGLV